MLNCFLIFMSVSLFLCLFVCLFLFYLYSCICLFNPSCSHFPPRNIYALRTWRILNTKKTVDWRWNFWAHPSPQEYPRVCCLQEIFSDGIPISGQKKYIHNHGRGQSALFVLRTAIEVVATSAKNEIEFPVWHSPKLDRVVGGVELQLLWSRKILCSQSFCKVTLKAKLL